MAKKSKDETNPDAWMATYSDMVTLLLCFFAVMLSMSTTSEAKFQAFVNSLQMQGADIVAVDPPQDGASQEAVVTGSIDSLYAYLKDYVEENGKEEQISLSKQEDMVFIRFQNDLFFEPDRYVLRADCVDTVNFITNGLKQFESTIRTVNICGHTAETGRQDSTISDWRLSGERAATIAISLEETAGFDKSKILVTGYGSNYPVASNASETERKLNRRVELIVVGKESQSNPDFYATLTSGEYGGTEDTGGIDSLLTGEGTAADAAATDTAATDAAAGSNAAPQQTDTAATDTTAAPQATTQSDTANTAAADGEMQTGVSPYND